MAEPELVTISIERLKELQALEEKLPTLIEEAVKEYKKTNLEKLHARDKANPSAVNARVKRYAEKHREEINRRLREKRQLEKQKKLELGRGSLSAPVSHTSSIVSSLVSSVNSSPLLMAAAGPSDDPPMLPLRPLQIIRPSKLMLEATERVLSHTADRVDTASIPHPYPTVKTDVTVRFDC
jgi:hypothetical protein